MASTNAMKSKLAVSPSKIVVGNVEAVSNVGMRSNFASETRKMLRISPIITEMTMTCYLKVVHISDGLVQVQRKSHQED